MIVLSATVDQWQLSNNLKKSLRMQLFP